MRDLLILIAFVILLMCCGLYCESKKDPYEEGGHWDYSIICNDGFKYKSLSNRRGTIPCLNSDGTPLKCNQKRY